METSLDPLCSNWDESKIKYYKLYKTPLFLDAITQIAAKCLFPHLIII